MFGNRTGEDATPATHLVPQSLSVQSDDDHGRVHQVTVAVEGEVVVLPRDVQHVSAESEPKRKMLSHIAKRNRSSPLWTGCTGWVEVHRPRSILVTWHVQSDDNKSVYFRMEDFGFSKVTRARQSSYRGSVDLDLDLERPDCGTFFSRFLGFRIVIDVNYAQKHWKTRTS